MAEKEITLIFRRDVYKIMVDDSESILDAALKHNIDLPHSCQTGICTTCMGRIKSGKVQMDRFDGLTQREKNEGCVLLCTGHPLTDGAVIEV